MKKKKKKNNKSNKLKVNKIRFSVCTVLNFLVLVSYYQALYVKPLCMIKNVIYIEPSTVPTLMFFIMFPIYVVYSINISVIRPKNRKKEFIKAAVVIVLTIITLVVNFTSVNYIDRNGAYYDKVYYSDCEIDDVEVSVERISNTVGSNATSNAYYIVCHLNTKSGKFVLNSGNFYNYEELYNYLVRMNNIVTIDTNGFNDLVNYEKNRLIPKSISDNNVDYIKRIEALR